MRKRRKKRREAAKGWGGNAVLTFSSISLSLPLSFFVFFMPLLFP